MPFQLILLGPPASGKGTHGRRIAAEKGAAYLSTGALLRETVQQGGKYAEVIAPYLERGDYIGDEMMCDILTKWLKKQNSGWVLDGFPRTLAQDDFLRSQLPTSAPVPIAIALDAPREILLERIQHRVECTACRWSGNLKEAADGKCPRCEGEVGVRVDDDVENFLSRYAWFQNHTVPVIQRYAEEGTLIRCDAGGAVEKVAAELSTAIASSNIGKENGKA